MVVVAVQGRVISNFALTHFSAAKHFSSKTVQIETANSGQPFGNFWEEISIYCASSIVMAAASLEALINELFLTPGPLQDAVKDFDTFFWGGKVSVRRGLFFKRTKRVRGLEMKPALEKYREAAKLLGASPLSKTDDPYRTADALIGFRNYLIHFKPLWDENRRDEELEQLLVGRFQLSPFVDEGAEFLATKCMSGGCSAWAVRSVVDFVTYFRDKSGMNSKKFGSFK
jgi:hypothetical protein